MSIGSHLAIVPLTLDQANALVALLHRHSDPTVSHRFSLGAVRRRALVAAAIVERPKARELPQYAVAEVSRLVTDGTANACSILYAASARTAKAMGFHKIQTYILEREPGISLRGAGWTRDPGLYGKDGKAWSNRAGFNRSKKPAGLKQRWSKVLNPLVEWDEPEPAKEDDRQLFLLAAGAGSNPAARSANAVDVEEG